MVFAPDDCSCGSLEALSREPAIPIVFDAGLNEYHIVGAGGAKVLIHHCMFCGGRAPVSRRPELFMHVTHEEMDRLRQVTRGLTTLDDVIQAFGSPDVDQPAGYSHTEAAGAGPRRATWHRQMIFGGLSDTANLHVAIGLNDKVQFSFMPKGARLSKAAEAMACPAGRAASHVVFGWSLHAAATSSG